jgi:NADH dehydrogenase [ubiquinone] 1 alpha subcomplex assembly factor 5
MTGDAAPFDRRAVRHHRDRAARRAEAALRDGRDPEFLHREVADRLVDRLREVRRPFADSLDLGCRHGALARALAGRPGARGVVQADLSEAMARSARAANRFFPTLVLDEEALPFAPASFDLVTASLSLHWVNDLPGALIQISRALRPDGLFLGAAFGGNTLRELRQALVEAEIEVEGGASPRVSPLLDVRDAGDLLQRAGFALPVVDRDVITVTYEHAFSLMHDLRLMGETNALTARRRGGTRRETMVRAAARYLERFVDKAGRLPATFEIVYLTGWAPDPSQPQPLRPGSAAARLADALKTEEVPLDDDADPGRE